MAAPYAASSNVTKEKSTYFYHAPRCLFCDKNNKRRHARRGRTWICQHCGEANPGPGMLKAIVGRFTTPPAGTAPSATVNGASTDQPAVKVAGTKIKGTNGAAAEPVAKPTAKRPPVAKPADEAQPTPPTPPKKRRLMSFIYE